MAHGHILHLPDLRVATWGLMNAFFLSLYGLVRKARIKKMMLCFWTVILCWATGIGEAVTREPARISVLIATGMPGSTYYHVGLGLASFWTTKLRDAGIRVSAAASEGSGENIEAIRIADADLILVEEFLCHMAFTGTAVYKNRALPELRTLSLLWPDTVHVLIRADKVKSGTLRDLVGITVATGLPDSGNRYTTEMLLKSVDPTGKKIRLRYLSHAAAIHGLRSGTVQALDISGGIPIPLLTSLLTEGKPRLEFLDIADEQFHALKGEGWDHAVRDTIPTGTYPGQTRPVKSLTYPNVLAVSASLDPQVVYELTKSLYENLEEIEKIHPVCRKLSLERALEGMRVPLHRGAARYYTERQLTIPDYLVE